MNTCETCNFLMDDHTIYTPKEYLAILADMQQCLKQGDFILVEQTCNFDDVLKSTWYSDYIEHIIQCKKCGSQFVCYANTYHGSARFYRKDTTPHSQANI
ncbi:MAG: hypothetical protein PHG73_01705 [Pygmaiobacter sp.]|nr:hypothetical protein [Pygmaiobacter sp.]